MTMMRSLMAAALLIAAPASATTLIDGSFEIQGAATPVTDYCYNGFAAGGNPACAAGAWGPNGGVILSGSGPWGGTTTPDGNFFGFVQGASIVSQSFTADASGPATLSWIDNSRVGNPGGGLQTYTVTLISDVSETLLGTYSVATGGWVSRSTSPFSLTNGETYTIEFAGLSQGDNTAFIDSIALTAGAVPEASTWSMLIAGFGMIGFAARRRRAVAA